MLVKKIIEGTLYAGSTSITFTDNDLPNSIISVTCSNPDIYPTNQVLENNTLTLSYNAQTSNLSIAVEINKRGFSIIDSLESNSDTDALSANQGKVLKGLIDNFSIDVDAEDVSYDNTVTGLTADDVQEAIDEVFQSVSSGKELIADAITDKGVATSATDTFATMATNIENIPSGGSDLNLPGLISLGTVTSWTNPITYTATADGMLIIYTGDSNTDSTAKSVTVNGVNADYGSVELYHWFNMGHAITLVFVKNGDVVSARYNSSRKYQLLFVPYAT